MNDLRIGLDEPGPFRPGREVRGEVEWSLERAPASMEVRLFWYTEGKGDQDVGLVETVEFSSPSEHARERFVVTLPREGPLSFSGELISLIWAVELVGGGEVAREELAVAIGDGEIRLDASVPPDEPT